MPIIRVELLEGRSRDQKREFVEGVTDLFVRVCGGTPETVQVVFFDVSKDDWGANGALVSDRQ